MIISCFFYYVCVISRMVRRIAPKPAGYWCLYLEFDAIWNISTYTLTMPGRGRQKGLVDRKKLPRF